MSKNIKKLVPKLRFPEFQDAGEWCKKSLGDITYKTDKKNKEGLKYPVYSINNKIGFTPQSEQFNGVDSNKRGYDITLYKIIEKNTFAYNPARINVGSIGFSGDLNNIIISSLYVCFKSTENVKDKFLQHFFETPIFNESVNNNVEGGIRNYLFYENFSIINIFLPGIKEQQKIADCLSSIDDLINAQSQKVEALKTHKKGLMQQLFPREGETVPRLRFPEFWDAGEWEVKPFDKLFTIGNGRDYKHLSNGNVPVYGSGGYMLSVDNFLYEGESVCIGRKGTINNPIFLTGKFWTVDTLFYTHSFVDCLPKFIFSTFQNINWLEHNEAGGVPSLSKANIIKIEVAVPKVEEQQRIANCLSSIDDLISTQIQKLESIKTHKKGLMQKLFPSTEADSE